MDMMMVQKEMLRDLHEVLRGASPDAWGGGKLRQSQCSIIRGLISRFTNLKKGRVLNVAGSSHTIGASIRFPPKTLGAIELQAAASCSVRRILSA